MNQQGEHLIDAIAQCVAGALHAHGVSPTDGIITVRSQCALICAEWGGEDHWIPKTYRPARDSLILDCLKNGQSCIDAAKRAGVHPNTARAVKRRQKTGFGTDGWVIS